MSERLHLTASSELRIGAMVMARSYRDRAPFPDELLTAKQLQEAASARGITVTDAMLGIEANVLPALAHPETSGASRTDLLQYRQQIA